MSWTAAALRALTLANVAHTVALVTPNGTAKVSDRALRYRAVENAPPRSRCLWCGKRTNGNGRRLDVAHINGFEDDCSRDNLGWSCRSCNVKCGRTLANAGLGRKTVQFNPSEIRKTAGGAKTIAHWAYAVMVMRGDLPVSNHEVDRAVELVRNTPQKKRSAFADRLAENPGRKAVPGEGAQSLGQWSHAVKMMRSYDPDESDAGYAIVMATPARLRSSWNRDLWKGRKREEVPF